MNNKWDLSESEIQAIIIHEGALNTMYNEMADIYAALGEQITRLADKTRIIAMQHSAVAGIYKNVAIRQKEDSE